MDAGSARKECLQHPNDAVLQALHVHHLFLSETQKGRPLQATLKMDGAPGGQDGEAEICNFLFFARQWLDLPASTAGAWSWLKAAYRDHPGQILCRGCGSF